MAKKVCALCGKDIGAMSGKVQIKDAVICGKCYRKLPELSLGNAPYTLEEAKAILAKQEAPEEVYTGPVPEYAVIQVVLKEALIGTGSQNLSELEVIINRQAAKGYRLHTISTTSSGSKGAGGGDRIQATMVFEKL